MWEDGKIWKHQNRNVFHLNNDGIFHSFDLPAFFNFPDNLRKNLIFSLREAIKSNPENWTNCAMYVQDITSPGINITAEISNQEAHVFKTMCHKFYLYWSKLNTEPIDLYEIPKLEPALEIFNSIGIKVFNMHQTVNSWQEHCICEFKVEIISILNKSIQLLNPFLRVIPIGSNQYGFESAWIQANKIRFDFLVNTSKFVLIGHFAIRNFNKIFSFQFLKIQQLSVNVFS